MWNLRDYAVLDRRNTHQHVNDFRNPIVECVAVDGEDGEEDYVFLSTPLLEAIDCFVPLEYMILVEIPVDDDDLMDDEQLANVERMSYDYHLEESTPAICAFKAIGSWS